MAQFSLHFILLFLLSSSCHPPYSLCPGNFSRLRKLAKLFPFSKLCLKLCGAGRAGLSGPGSPLSAAQFPRKLSKLDNSHALHID